MAVDTIQEAIDFFKSEIKGDDLPRRVEDVHKVKWIAGTIGPHKTVNDIIPFLHESQKGLPGEVDDEFMHALAEEYYTLADYVGDESNFEALLHPLAHLATQEETVVRDKAVESICAIVMKASDKTRVQLTQKVVFGLVQSLSEGERFTSRVSACGLLATTYKFCEPHQKEELRKIFNKLCADDTPMVRRAAASKMKDFFQVTEKPLILKDLINTFKTLAQDDTQDSIRVSCLNAALELAKVLNGDENKTHTLIVVKAAAEDRSWRVRLSLAKQFDQLCAAFGPDITSSFLLPPFILLLRDFEQEVRTAAVLIIEKCAEYISPDHIQNFIVPCFANLGMDAAQSVRAALATVIGPVAQALGREPTQKHLLSLILELMRDEFHDVRLNVVKHAGQICEVLGVDTLAHSLLNTIKDLMNDSQWRIRLSVVNQIPTLAKQFGADMFQSKLEALFIQSLNDSVFAVREATINNIRLIAETFEPQWTVEHLLPKILDQYNKATGYTYRMATLHAIPQLSAVMTPEQINQSIVPLLKKALKDIVPNIRFAAAKTCAYLVEQDLLTPAIVNNDIRPALEELTSDTDIDVQYFANQALKKCNKA